MFSGAIRVAGSVLDLSGAVGTIDAMGMQREIARKIVEAEADYVGALKSNQPLLDEGVQTSFEAAAAVSHLQSRAD